MRWSYDGPVCNFGVCICNKWHGETIAETEKKARSNLTYQCKKTFSLLPTARIELPGKLKILETEVRV